ncbi:phage virion morphogenesis protein, partial [Escherichia coli]
TGRHGPHITGYDTDRRGIRTFYRADIEEYLEIRTRRVGQETSVRDRMFERLRRYVKILQADNEEVRVGFNGDPARIARVHHFGLRDNVVPGVTTQYPARELLGLSVKDKTMIRETLIRSLKGGMQ